MQPNVPTRQVVIGLVESLPLSQLTEVVDFIMFLQMRERDEKKLRADFEELSVSALDFWDNVVDDEVWNDA